MKITIVIPARYGSRRYPGKPMALIRGQSLLNRVYSIARAVRGIDSVYVATDDVRVAEHARTFDAQVIMTSPDCENGTERVHQAMLSLPAEQRPDAVINLQGDAVLTPPWVIQALADAFHNDPTVSLATPAVQCSWSQVEEIRRSKEVNPTSGTMVTFDKNFNALYFSKAIIPYLRIVNREAPPPVFRHVGIYGYRFDILDRLARLPQTPLEIAEQLEQLRALENGIPIRVVLVDYRGRTHWSIDAPEDVIKVEELLEREGELIRGE